MSIERGSIPSNIVSLTSESAGIAVHGDRDHSRMSNGRLRDALLYAQMFRFPHCTRMLWEGNARELRDTSKSMKATLVKVGTIKMNFQVLINQ